MYIECATFEVQHHAQSRSHSSFKLFMWLDVKVLKIPPCHLQVVGYNATLPLKTKGWMVQTDGLTRSHEENSSGECLPLVTVCYSTPHVNLTFAHADGFEDTCRKQHGWQVLSGTQSIRVDRGKCELKSSFFSSRTSCNEVAISVRWIFQLTI